MKIYIYISTIFTLFSFTQCNFFPDEEDEEKVPKLVSQVDGDKAISEINTDSAKKYTYNIELGDFSNIQAEQVAVIADSLNTADSSWRKRHYDAISKYNEQYDDINEPLYYRFNIAIFKLLLYHPKEIIAHFDQATMLEMEFWNDRLKEEIRHNVDVEEVELQSIINMSQDHCNDCDSLELQLIEGMVKTLYEDF